MFPFKGSISGFDYLYFNSLEGFAKHKRSFIIDDDWIRTRDFWRLRRPLLQLCH